MNLNPEPGSEGALEKEELALAKTLILVVLACWGCSGQTAAVNVSDRMDGSG